MSFLADDTSQMKLVACSRYGRFTLFAPVRQVIIESLSDLKEGQDNIVSGQQEMMDMLKVVMNQTRVSSDDPNERAFEMPVTSRVIRSLRTSTMCHIIFICKPDSHFIAHYSIRTSRGALRKALMPGPNGAPKPSRLSKSSKRWLVARSS